MTIVKKSNLKDLPALGRALNAESWSWLETNQPELAVAIETEVARGATPAEIKRFVMMRTDRYELAQRCHLAAEWLVGNG